MALSERRKNEIETMKKSILSACKAIINREGIEGISVRKIAVMIQYSPSLLYHYYPNKDQLIAEVISSMYQEMNQKLRNVPSDTNPKTLFYNRLKTFIELALNEPIGYIAAMRSTHDIIRHQTNVLMDNVITLKPGFQLMSQSISEISKMNDLTKIEEISQIIWISTYGLIDRIIHEKPPICQTQRLIEAHLNYHISALERMSQ